MKLRVKPVPQESLQRGSVLKEAAAAEQHSYPLPVSQRKLKGISPASSSSPMILENLFTKYFAYIAYDDH